MPFVILPTNSASGGYNVTNSLRFNSASSDYLSRTQGAGDRQKWTYSVWVKRAKLGTNQNFGICQADSANNNIMPFQFTTADKIDVYDYNGAISFQYITTQVFRDVSAWYNIMLAVDTTQATASNRVRLYVNGSELTAFDSTTYPSQNYNFNLNQTGKLLTIGAYYYSIPVAFCDMYMSDIFFIDGQQLTPSSFGETDTDTGIWKPKAYTGTYGTNGFYLQFKNSASLGTDSSGNGNTFTVNNLTSVDQSTDTPTNNFCTWNAVSAPYSAPTLTEGNLVVTNNGANWQGAKGTIGVSQGKWYWEARFDNTTFTYNHGVIDESVNFSAINPMNATGYTGFYNTDGGEMKKDATDTTADYGTFSTNDIIGIALNMDLKQISIYKNGTIHVSNFALSTTSTLVFPCTVYYSSGVCSYNFGNPPYSANSYTDGAGYGNFSYAVPSGYYALNTKNLANFG
jgi:hypothetical protein